MTHNYNMRYPITTEQNIPDRTSGSGVAPHIDGSNGNWFIGDVDTGVKAQGPIGPIGLTGPQGASGETGPKGDPGVNGTNGTNGTDGITPTIDPTSKHWMTGSTDTGVYADGSSRYENAVFQIGYHPSGSKIIRESWYYKNKTELTARWDNDEKAWKLYQYVDSGSLPIEQISNLIQFEGYFSRSESMFTYHESIHDTSKFTTTLQSVMGTVTLQIKPVDPAYAPDSLFVFIDYIAM